MEEKSKNYKCASKLMYIVPLVLMLLMVLCLSSCKDSTTDSDPTTTSKTATESTTTVKTTTTTKATTITTKSTTTTTKATATTTTTKATTTTTANPYRSLQRLWIAGNGYAKMNVYNIDSNGHLTGSLELSDEGQSIFFDLDVAPDYEGNYYQVLTANNTTVDFWFYFQSELSMICTMNSQNGESIQFTMN